MKKVYNFTKEKEQFKELVDDLIDLKITIVFTNGCFDLLHSDHVYQLNKSKELGDILIVGVNSDKSVKTLKGESRPIVNELDRVYMLGSLAAIDFIVIFDESSVNELIEFVKPNIITKSNEYRIEDLENVGGKFMRETNGKIVLIPRRGGISTTALINKIKNS